jgi:hypothetical protein
MYRLHLTDLQPVCSCVFQCEGLLYLLSHGAGTHLCLWQQRQVRGSLLLCFRGVTLASVVIIIYLHGA